MRTLLVNVLGTTLCVDQDGTLDQASLHKLIKNRTGIPICLQRLSVHGRAITKGLELLHVVDVNLRLLGGKGGFGSLLRSLKSVKKTTDFSNCRDLNGNRLRASEVIQKLRKWYAEADEREQQKMNQKMQAMQKHMLEQESIFNIMDYVQNTKDIALDVGDSVADGYQIWKQSQQTEPLEVPKERPCVYSWMNDISDESSEVSSEVTNSDKESSTFYQNKRKRDTNPDEEPTNKRRKSSE
eukprot:TRINITY_DN556_c0_g1_i2.p1 TRINITY_DN556_c0_g1~~TRINITY_DN556_c0_g1_i2.p1  ORF type:complete len:240 (+),score=43.61 TRINITY_DN556_c0_g1_i2:61-780(+)